MKLNDIKKNPQNPRVIKDTKFELLVNSIIEFPQMLLKRKLAIADGVIIGGNQRYEALKKIKSMGTQQVIDRLNQKDFNVKQIDSNLQILSDLFNDKIDNYIIDCSEMTESERKRFVVLDNSNFGEWDIDLITALYDNEELIELGFDVPDFDSEVTENKDDNEIEKNEKLCPHCNMPL